MRIFLQYAWLIPVIPIVMSAILILLGRRLPEPFGGIAALCAIGTSFLLAVGAFFALVARPPALRIFTHNLFTWIPGGGFTIEAGFRVDPLSSVFMLLITGVGSLIFIYAIGYMHGDPGFTRFFSYLSLFVGSMLILVMGDNYLLMFVGWELVGACSYLLIGFWFTDTANMSAAKKAFVTNRIGDVGFVIGLMLLFATVGTLAYQPVFLSANAGLISTGTATAICLLLLVGATGKSAQIPLYVWLPDAMAGPTPVSALIHAATMVTAGVYMIARSNALFSIAPTAQMIVVFVGIFTAFFAGIAAFGQWKMKKVLAYSTVSQIGYMIAGVGIGGAGFTAGVFHVVSHGFFKALLFLGAGSVMHGMHNEEDIRKLGGLSKKMPITAATFLIGCLSISGIPPLSGFFSKDAVLGALFDSGTSYGYVAWGIGLGAAFLTAIYMFRLYFLTFSGEPRWDEGVHPHESPTLMWLPLVALAGLTTIGGALNLPGLDTLQHWFAPVFRANNGEYPSLGGQELLLLTIGASVAVGGVATAWFLFRRTAADQRAEMEERLGPIAGVVRNAYYVDSGLTKYVQEPGWEVTGALEVVDQKGIDAAFMGIGGFFAWFGEKLKPAQSGLTRSYAAVVLVGAIVLVGAMLLIGGVGQ